MNLKQPGRESSNQERWKELCGYHSRPLKLIKEVENKLQSSTISTDWVPQRCCQASTTSRNPKQRHSKAQPIPKDQTRMNGQEQADSTHPTLKTSASFRNAELMRMGNGYFWKSLGKRTTASHCSPSLPDLRPKADSRSYRRYLRVVDNAVPSKAPTRPRSPARQQHRAHAASPLSSSMRAELASSSCSP